MIEVLASTDMYVGELVNLNIDDVLFNERECIVLGKGDTERTVYFDTKTKIHLLKYLESRNDNNKSLFVSLKNPHDNFGINDVEKRFVNWAMSYYQKVHPQKIRRKMLTNTIVKEMLIDEV